MSRYVRLLYHQLRASVLLSAQYRADFLIDAAIEVLWAGLAVVPLLIVFGQRSDVAGWTFGEALLVTGFFTLLQGVLEGAINPSLTAVVEHVRKGTLDFVLLKPADAQFLVSTARFSPWRAINVVTAAVIFSFAFRHIGAPPTAGGLLLAAASLLAAVTILYSLWILTVSASFYVVKVDNLTYLFSSIFDAARWPASVFRGGLRVLFTVVIPLAAMTTYPAEALLGRLSWQNAAIAMGMTVGLAVVSRLVWVRSLSRYTSAGG
ncbi:MAG: ABC-2 family transporter protein [Polyangiaceae bacterium]|jgi:ABC-2 type transport system permease protein|nr:ABC-2 family transporter protein [Polyangiaceae bacterium]MBK8937985.1 ABC-2 family transporter protein [Polyangiaceae bacterium]